MFKRLRKNAQQRVLEVVIEVTTAVSHEYDSSSVSSGSCTDELAIDPRKNQMYQEQEAKTNQRPGQVNQNDKTRDIQYEIKTVQGQTEMLQETVRGLEYKLDTMTLLLETPIQQQQNSDT
ncbi:hypothetical protein BGZ76_006791 [Entomortierella beljakovae]|nr:hypothetical protein BGZ76_006791 [Entomortierella beljakovae]